MNDWLQIALIVAGIACGLFPVFKLLLRPKVDPLSEDDAEPALGGFTAPLAAQMPLSSEYRHWSWAIPWTKPPMCRR